MTKELKFTNPPTLAQVGIQKFLFLAGKACLSTIPFAAFAADIAQIGVELANEHSKGQVTLANRRITEAFVEDLAHRIDMLDATEKTRLINSNDHQNAADAAIRVLISETNIRVALALSRAVSRLATMSEEAAYKAQCARVIAELTEPMLHALQTNDRFYRHQLNVGENEICAALDEKTQQMAALLIATMRIPDWNPVMRRIMDIGLIEQHFDAGTYDTTNLMVQTAPTTEYGRLIIDLCFENPTVPQFGKFAL